MTGAVPIPASTLQFAQRLDQFSRKSAQTRLELVIEQRAVVGEVATAVCASYGITDTDGLINGFTQVVTESRDAVASGKLRFPADIRLLETACRAASEPTGKAVGMFIASALADQTAHWSLDSGDILPESVAICNSWISLLKSL